MTIFDAPNDAPNAIHKEGEGVKVQFLHGVPATGQGTVKWNIPAPADGCSAENSAYCGAVILAHTSPLQPEHAPKDGVFYTGDNTLDPDLHVGDRIGDALVIGAFYEGEEKARGEVLTQALIVNNLVPKTPYYIAIYIVDCQGRYHTKGVRAYSDNLAKPLDPNTASTQTIVMDPAITPTDGTGLLLDKTYEFDLLVDPTFPSGTNARTVEFSVLGAEISTYDALLKEINKAIALVDNPPQSPVPLNEGRYYVSSEPLVYQWDGYQHNITDAIIDNSDPRTLSVGEYWLTPSTQQLVRWDGTQWVSINAVSSADAPTGLIGGDDYWFDGSTAYIWKGGTWCDTNTVLQSTDPMLTQYPNTFGHYWFNQTTEELLEWDVNNQQWSTAFALAWPVAPTTLPSGTLWYDLSSSTLKVLDGSPATWTTVPEFAGSPVPVGSPTTVEYVITSEAEPTTQDPSVVWYQPSTEMLFQWNATLNDWDVLDVIVWPFAPNDTQSCDLWWDITTDQLYKWDSIHTEWDSVLSFAIQLTDPFTPSVPAVGNTWFDGTSLRVWDGSEWQLVSYMQSPTDPTIPTIGDVWHDTQNDVWNEWNGSWQTFNPIVSENDPSSLPQETLWFNPSINTLNQLIGSAWVSVPFSNVKYTPTTGQLWFDTSTDTLMRWNGTTWEVATPLATAEIVDGNIQFTTTFTGSSACVMIIVPQGSISGAGSQALATGQAVPAGHDFVHYAYHSDVSLPTTDVSSDDFLFDFLQPPAVIFKQIYGTDGVSTSPTYLEQGVGDDGSSDERRRMVKNIREQLGYPTVDVELTPSQINMAIDLALGELRSKSASGYKRGFFFLDIKPGFQHYKLTDRQVGFNKVVTVMSAHRFTSAFLSSAHGAGVYGQIVLQHLYNMGTFDLVSYHLVSQYVEQMEHLFATRLTFHWNESNRTLSFYQSFTAKERVLLDVMVERTEQEILVDRWTWTWVERFALAESMRMLAQIRGKYASLPGAGGGISLNASDLLMQHDSIKQQLYEQIDDYVVNSAEDVGQHSTFIIG